MIGNCLRIYRHCRRRWSDEAGATSIEYALIAGGVSIVIVATVFSIGDFWATTFNGINDQGFGG